MRTEWLELEERLYALRDEIARRPRPQQAQRNAAAQPAGDARLLQVDRALARIQSELYPTCERCGDRIEMERLRAQPEATTCQGCETAEKRLAR